MNAYFLEELFDKYGNASKYVIPSVVVGLEVLNFKISIFIQDSRWQIIVGFGIARIILFSISSRTVTNRFQRRGSAIISSGNHSNI